MLERQPPAISITCDDLNTERGLENIERTGLPIHGDVIVTGVQRFPEVRYFVKKHKGRLERVEPGVHISLFDGEFPQDRKNLFGNRGRLHAMLHEIEDPKRLHDPHYRRKFNKRTTKILAPYAFDIKGEINRQIDFWKEIYGAYPFYLSYHFGMHYIPLLHTLYADVAKERDIPYRHAAQYTGLPKKHDLAVYDRLNDPLVTPQRVLVALHKINAGGHATDIMVHLGDAQYGHKQVDAFTDARVRHELKNWRIEMPHTIWRRLQNGGK